MLFGNFTGRHSDSTVTILDGFEDGDIAEYVNNTSYYSVTSTNPIVGAYSLRADQQFGNIAHASAIAESGYEYGVRIRPAASDSRNSLMTHIQEPTYAIRDCYYFELDAGNDEFVFRMRNGGEATWKTSASAPDGSITAGSVYRLYVRFLADDETIRLVLNTDEGVTLATSETTDTTYSAGNLGFYCGAGGVGSLYDRLSRVAL